MRKLQWKIAAAISLLSMPETAQAQDGKIDEVLRKLGGEAVREIHTDICFPATSEEYEALGKNAILMLDSSSAVGTELPLRSVYAMRKGVRIPLYRVYLLGKQHNAAGDRTTQVSFYLLPIEFMKADVQLLADFSGDRRGFGFMSFNAKEGLDRAAPAFARLDEYDQPSDPDPAVVTAVIAREYPDHVH
jgi:hypothetical protein